MYLYTPEGGPWCILTLPPIERNDSTYLPFTPAAPGININTNIISQRKAVHSRIQCLITKVHFRALVSFSSKWCSL